MTLTLGGSSIPAPRHGFGSSIFRLWIAPAGVGIDPVTAPRQLVHARIGQCVWCPQAHLHLRAKAQPVDGAQGVEISDRRDDRVHAPRVIRDDADLDVADEACTLDRIPPIHVPLDPRCHALHPVDGLPLAPAWDDTGRAKSQEGIHGGPLNTIMSPSDVRSRRPDRSTTGHRAAWPSACRPRFPPCGRRHRRAAGRCRGRTMTEGCASRSAPASRVRGWRAGAWPPRDPGCRAPRGALAG